MYTEYETGEHELYDISNGPCWEWHRAQKGDPCMLKNRADKKGYRSIQQRLAHQLERLHSD